MQGSQRVLVSANDKTTRGFATLALLYGGFDVKPMTADELKEEPTFESSILVLDYPTARDLPASSSLRDRMVVLTTEAEQASFSASGEQPYFSLLRIPLDAEMLVRTVGDCKVTLAPSIRAESPDATLVAEASPASDDAAGSEPMVSDAFPAIDAAPPAAAVTPVSGQAGKAATASKKPAKKRLAAKRRR